MWLVLTRNSLVMVLLLLSSCRKSDAGATRMFLASSLAPLGETIKALSREQVDLVFLSSSAIAKQIAQGAPCEIGILADEAWRDYLVQRDAITAETMTVATNRLVLAGTTAMQGSATEILAELSPTEKLIIGDPDYVPLGAYTKEAFLRLKVYEKLAPQFVRASSARQAHIMLEQKAARFAVLYHSDAAHANLAFFAFIDDKLHRPIRYPFIVCKTARASKLPALRRMLTSEAWRRALISAGLE